MSYQQKYMCEFCSDCNHEYLPDPEIARLTSANEKLDKCSHNKCAKCGFDDAEYILDLKDKISRLRDALIEYGQHLKSCSQSPLFPDTKCDCGLSEALASPPKEEKL